MNNFNDLKIAVAGTGYVGLSMATLLSQHQDSPPTPSLLHPQYGVCRKSSSLGHSSSEQQ